MGGGGVGGGLKKQRRKSASFSASGACVCMACIVYERNTSRIQAPTSTASDVHTMLKYHSSSIVCIVHTYAGMLGIGWGRHSSTKPG